MVEDKKVPEDLEKTVIRICPACGVVNPAGPSENCPHLQLARFDGMDEPLSGLLGDVAEARRTFQAAVTELKDRVRAALRNHEAEIETTQKVRSSQVEQLSQNTIHKGPALSLEAPPAPKVKSRPARRRSRTRGPLTVNPRQLELIAREPSKGDA